MNNTACLNGLRMTAAEKKHQLMLKISKHVSKYIFVLVVHLKNYHKSTNQPDLFLRYWHCRLNIILYILNSEKAVTKFDTDNSCYTVANLDKSTRVSQYRH